MGLFHRQEEANVEISYNIGIGTEDTIIVIGLGNDGKEYDLTRHNIGFLCLDDLAKAENGSWGLKKALKSNICSLKIGNKRILLVKPTTFMNNSGEAVLAIQQFYKIDNAHTIVVHDELDIPFGQIRTRTGGGAAGHNGIKSLISLIGEDFGRIRVGIANEFSEKADSADFVLGKFTKDEQTHLKHLKNEANSMLNDAIFGDKLTTETRSFI
jgi:PTH1 family peptidyl-tRNA hydrolase